jgi:hypothetical protein
MYPPWAHHGLLVRMQDAGIRPMFQNGKRARRQSCQVVPTSDRLLRLAEPPCSSETRLKARAERHARCFRSMDMGDDGCGPVGCGMTEPLLKPCHGASGSSSCQARLVRERACPVTGSELKCHSRLHSIFAHLVRPLTINVVQVSPTRGRRSRVCMPCQGRLKKSMKNHNKDLIITKLAK